MAASVLDAHRLNQLGWCVLPARLKGKRPSVTWKEYQDHRPEGDELDALFARFTNGCNLWVATGAISRLLGLDLDNRAAELYWREALGDEAIDTACMVKTSRGFHLLWTIEEGQAIPGWAVHPKDGEDGPSYDVRCEGGGIIAPPSVHESGFVYEWVRGPEYLSPCPAALLAGPPSQDGSPQGGDGPVGTRSLLSKLLEDPPDGENSGRNDWLTKVAGHYAKMVKHEDAYRAMVVTANRSLQYPLDDTEIEKTIVSIWQSETAKPLNQIAADEQPNARNGWLMRTGTQMLCPIQIKGFDPELAVWADFDAECRGVLYSDQEIASYWVRLTTTTGRTVDTEITATMLGSWADLSKWLAGKECLIHSPNGDPHFKTPPGHRLQRVLISQDAPTYRVVDYLGWHEGEGFITHDGVITKDGLQPYNSVVPHPRLVGWAPHHYGFIDQAEAKALLQEVMTFHDETATAVFGSWCVAVILKHQIMQYASLFPIMAIEAGSESGKSTGFFAMMIQMFSGTRKAQNTIPGMRDALAGNRSGIVWMDDKSDTSQIEELIRHATAEGEMTKKGQDRTTQETVRLVGAVVLSAESLGALHAEKALADRSLLLEVPNPKGRMSRHNPALTQWQDVVAMHARFGQDGISGVSGSIVQMVLEHARLVDDLWAQVCGASAGRYNDKMCILKVCSQVLARMIDDPEVINRVETWCGSQEDLGQENYVSLTMLPDFLVEHAAILPRTARFEPPAFYDSDDRLWVSPTRLAAWGDKKYRGKVRSDQLGHANSISGMLDALGASDGVRKHTEGSSDGRRMRYREIPAAITTRIFKRAGFTSSSDTTTTSDSLWDA